MMRNSEKIIVSLTTIDSRISAVGECLRTLLRQNYGNYEVRLNVSKDPYLLDKGVSENFVSECVPDGVSVVFVENTGPYRKLLPVLETVDENDIVVTVDDDVIYPDNFLSTLVAANMVYDCPIAYRGRDITIDSGGISGYGKWRKSNLTGSALSKLPTGKDGVLYRRRYFHRGVFDIDAAKALAPTTDDLWFKWHTAINGKDSVLLFDSLSESFDSIGCADVSLFESFNKHTNNDVVVCNLEKYMSSKYGWSMFSELRQKSL